MKLYADCARCGGKLELDAQMVANMAALGDDDTPLEHAPGSCPGEGGVPAAPKPLRRFRLQVMAVELPPVGSEEYERLGIGVEAKAAEALRWPDPELGADEDGTPRTLELMAGIGHTVEARNFPEAVNGDLTGWLNSAWPRFQESAAFADLPPGGPVPTVEPVTAVPVDVVPAAPSRLIVPGQQ